MLLISLSAIPVSAGVTGANPVGQETLSLEGEWKFSLDNKADGVSARGFPKVLPDTIHLPGTTEEAGKGTPARNINDTTHLSRPFPYTGPAWYQRDIVIPEEWKGKPITLVLERTKNSTLWVDGKCMGTQDSLATGHAYELTNELPPGQHQLTLLVDNAKLPPGKGHQTSDDTQTNWNGVIGRIELRADSRVWLDDVRIDPDVEHHSIKVRVMLGKLTPEPASGTLTLTTHSWNDPKNGMQPTRTYKFKDMTGGSVIEAVYDMGANVRLWDEFSPELYQLNATLEARSGNETFTAGCREGFGMREFSAHGTQFRINGQTTMLRGKHDACTFPLTGYAPMDVDSWKHVFMIAKSYGINHYRFHTWCPPEAAFTAADILGIYLQPELCNNGFGSDEYFRAEGRRILTAFGNHPSFVMMSLGNETMHVRDKLVDIVRDLRALDQRHLYTQASNYDFDNPKLAAGDDYWTTMRVAKGTDGAVRGSFSHADIPLGHVQSGPAGTMMDFSEAVHSVPVPVIGHEIGQYQVFPDFKEISKYRGVLKPWNLEVFRDRLKTAGMLDQGDDFFKASGALAAICYREDIEAALRTHGMGGFQLLDLQDFPGQGTALVGILDAFMDSKGIITPQAWREFCSETVPLARFTKYGWTTDETFSATVQVAHYGQHSLGGAVIKWTLEDSTGKQVACGQLPKKDIPQGSLTDMGNVRIPLTGIAAPQALVLTTFIDGTSFRNHYRLWVYPDGENMEFPHGITVIRILDESALKILADGGSVVMFPEPSKLKNSVEGFFASDFWCYPMFRKICEQVKMSVAPGTLGLLCDPKHPALAEFPTDFHSDWQWFPIVMRSRAVILDETPASYRPLVQVIDNFERNHKLGLVFEAKVGPGKLLVCSADLPGVPDQPEARQLRKSLLDYAASREFAPTQELDAATLLRLLR